jgi:hypothetical protein
VAKAGKARNSFLFKELRPNNLSFSGVMAMDGQEICRNHDIAAFVVRQFSSSRIERQLVAQIFDLMFDRPSREVQHGGAEGLEPPHAAKISVPATTSRNPRRRAA